MTADNGSSLTVFSGSQKSIQVNSSDPAAVDLSSAMVDLSQANGGNGGNFAVVTRESQSDANVTLASGNWVNAAGITSDPFAMVDPPQTKPGNAPGPPSSGSLSRHDPHVLCDEYQPGYYPATVSCNSADGLDLRRWLDSQYSRDIPARYLLSRGRLRDRWWRP